ncbi:helix-turn-helix domain-containing protein [Ruminococcus champanellensis]|uniref:helix-turn-helix domain-containing protein n=1 Tax=Ruminococcus champanellensis TaxID=1161942 RepID=UPI0023F2EA5F|nr:helix-turn-helix transcriptional regulator [Ruminococcus champanellensis]
MDQTRTGSLIRRLRLEQGMTQLALAERLGAAIRRFPSGNGAAVRLISPSFPYYLKPWRWTRTPCSGGIWRRMT